MDEKLAFSRPLASVLDVKSPQEVEEIAYQGFLGRKSSNDTGLLICKLHIFQEFQMNMKIYFFLTLKKDLGLFLNYSSLYDAWELYFFIF